MIVGVLALQGDFEAHRKMLESSGDSQVEVLEVRDDKALARCDALVIPGGESTVMSRLCDRYGLWQPLQEKLQAGMGVLGTCAGMILLARDISGATTNFQQKTLGALDIDVARNAYGAQVDSFEADLDVPVLGDDPLRAVFIRAPRITRTGDGVEVLATHSGAPVLVQQATESGQVIMAASFHPEIADDSRLHRHWLATLQTSR